MKIEKLERSAKALTDFKAKNIDAWAKELCDFWLQGKWHDCCLEEYSVYKLWVHLWGTDYFVQLKEYVDEETKEVNSLDSIQHDAWVMFKDSIGCVEQESIYERMVKAMAKEFGIATPQDEANNLPKHLREIQGGIA